VRQVVERLAKNTRLASPLARGDPMLRTLHDKVFFLLALALPPAAAAAQGIETNQGAMVLYGSASTCTKPASVDYKKVRDKTPEWKTIKAEAVPKDSARYSLLVSEMNTRIKRHCKKIAQDKGNDCVVRDGDVADDKGLKVDDLTDQVLKALESEVEDS
jgi:hypothetical protein